MGQILIAEDDPAMLRSLRMALHFGGHKVQVVSDGLEAVAALRHQHFDLLLTDIVMPKLNGVEVARHARVNQPGLHVTFITGFGEGALRARNIEIDGMRVLSKPFKLRELIEHVDDMLLH